MGEATDLKQPKSFLEQLAILEDRNMIIEDREHAISVLKRVNYYRLTAYALQVKKDDSYNKNISFEKMYRLYKFDKKLRHLILGILETIEISLRTYMAYNLSIKYGPEAFKKADIFKKIKFYSGYDDIYGRHHKGLLDEIESEINKNRDEPFIKHHISKYDGRFPTWVVVEVFSFGMLSKTYCNLNVAEQKEISRNCFSINNMLLESWLNNLSYVRNICAHYGRLYNKKLAITPKIHNKYQRYNLDINKIYVSILAIKELTINTHTSEWTNFRTQLEALIEEYIDVIDLNLIGFPDNWLEIIQ